MGVTCLWAYAVYGRHLLVGIRCLWASPTCVHTLFMGVTYFDSVDLLIIYDVPLVEFMYLVFTHMPVESNRSRLRFLLLCLCYVFRALTNSLVC